MISVVLVLTDCDVSQIYFSRFVSIYRNLMHLFSPGYLALIIHWFLCSTLCKSGSGLLTQLAVLRWECPGIPPIPFIPPSVMSGHVFTLNSERVRLHQRESCNRTRSGILVFSILHFLHHGLLFALHVQLKLTFLVLFPTFLVLVFLITNPIEAELR